MIRVKKLIFYLQKKKVCSNGILKNNTKTSLRRNKTYHT